MPFRHAEIALIISVVEARHLAQKLKITSATRVGTLDVNGFVHVDPRISAAILAASENGRFYRVV